MNISRFKTPRIATYAFGLMLAVSPAAFAQSDSNRSTQNTQGTTANQSGTGTQRSGTNSTSAGTDARERSVASGEKAKISGVVTKREADTFTVRDVNGVDTVVRLTDTTRVTERKSNPFRRGKNYATTGILPGLSLEVEGRGDATGQLSADRVKFSDTEFKVARSLEARVNPVEGRVGAAEGRIGQVEQNAQRLSGQLEELAAVSNAAKGGAVTAQATAEAAVGGVRATNDRISALDDYTPQQTAAVNFRVGSAVLSPEARTQLDEIAQQASNAKGYVIEVSGFASADGGVDLNRRLSERRADAVVRYLAENHRIPLRRIITPFGYGESQAVADNTTRDGRARNRRVEVKVLVNRGLTQPTPEMSVPNTGGSTNSTDASGTNGAAATTPTADTGTTSSDATNSTGTTNTSASPRPTTPN